MKRKTIYIIVLGMSNGKNVYLNFTKKTTREKAFKNIANKIKKEGGLYYNNRVYINTSNIITMTIEERYL